MLATVIKGLPVETGRACLNVKNMTLSEALKIGSHSNGGPLGPGLPTNPEEIRTASTGNH
jgi:hypothetical protein